MRRSPRGVRSDSSARGPAPRGRMVLVSSDSFRPLAAVIFARASIAKCARSHRCAGSRCNRGNALRKRARRRHHRGCLPCVAWHCMDILHRRPARCGKFRSTHCGVTAFVRHAARAVFRKRPSCVHCGADFISMVVASKRSDVDLDRGCFGVNVYRWCTLPSRRPPPSEGLIRTAP